VTELRTERLLLRQWRDSDLEPFADMNADADVMEYFPAPLGREESDAHADRIRAKMAQDGWGLWAVEVVGHAPFAGIVGLWVPRLELHFTPCVEIVWRLAREHWGNGYATEAAQVSLAYGFEELALEEIVAWTAVGNERSRRVMERLGMTRDPADDFEHPLAPPESAVRPQVLYRLRRSVHLGSADSRS
jgi:RimJ/RimL family protein N-acetyltransferase